MTRVLDDAPQGAGAIRRLLAERPLDRSAVDAFLASHRFPLVEGASCTFVWRGEADAVALKHWIFGLPQTQAFARLAGTDLWYLVIDLPARSRIEYKLEIAFHGDRRWIEDPLNPMRARDPFGANSVAYGDGYVVPEWVLPHPETRPGTLDWTSRPSAALGRDVSIGIYLPARFRRSRRYPLLVVHDGADFVQYASLQTVLDNLIHRLEVPEMVVALINPGDRLVEYANDPQHARFITAELLPWLAAEFPLAEGAENRCLMGASFGAVAALTTAARSPGTFGRLLLESGSFAFTDIGHSMRGPVFEPVVSFMNAFRAAPTRISERVFLSCGQYESLIYENRSLVPVLQSAGMNVRYVEARDGHNWENWRDRLRDGLTWLYPGPMWMVYE
jgi:enterochelin esterase family protein